MLKSLFAAFTAAMLFGVPAFAQREVKKDPPKKAELPKSGLLSSSTVAGNSDTKVGIQWGDPFGKGGDGGAPIQGSVSRASPTEWNMFLMNASKDPYSVDVKVVQYGSRGETIKSDSFSYSLKPGQKTNRRIPASTLATNADLKLDNWKDTKPKEPAVKTAAVGAQKGVTPPNVRK